MSMDRVPKRKELSPGIHQDKEKIAKNSGPNHVSHQSVMLANEVTPASNIKLMSPSKLDPITPGKSPTKGNIDSESLYKMFLRLELRVSQNNREINKLKDQLSDKEEEVKKLDAKVKESGEVINELKARIVEIEKVPSVVPSVSWGEFSEGNAGSDAFLETLRREVPLISEGCAAVEGKVDKINENISTMTTNFEDLQRKTRKANIRNHLEGEQRDMYSRRETVRVTGVPFNPAENTNQLMCRIACSIGVQLSDGDISVSHRSGRMSPNRPRAIIVKFARRDIKHQIMINRRRTKDITTDDNGRPVKIFIDEHLTPMRANICKKLRQERVNHYTRDGKLFVNTAARDAEENWKVFNSPDDWEQMDFPVTVKEELGIFPRD